MNFFEQLHRRRLQLRRTQHSIAQVTGMTSPHVSNILKGQKDAQASTLEALADALDAQWVLVPKHLLPEVQRLLSGKAIGPDEAPSTVDQLFAGGANE